METRRVRTPVLEIAYLESGPADGVPVVLLHGFPDDPHCYDGVAPMLAQAGYRVLVPWLRGYGPTRFLRDDAPRSGEQAALGADARDFLDALGIERAVLAGYDWGGRAACIVAALWPERVHGLVTIGGYNIQNIAAAGRPGNGRAGMAVLVSVVFSYGTGSGGAGKEPPRAMPADVDAVVAELPVR